MNTSTFALRASSEPGKYSQLQASKTPWATLKKKLNPSFALDLESLAQMFKSQIQVADFVMDDLAMEIPFRREATFSAKDVSNLKSIMDIVEEDWCDREILITFNNRPNTVLIVIEKLKAEAHKGE